MIKRLNPALVAAALTLLPWAGQAATLTYENDNKWVAQEDTAPLRQLQTLVRNGKTNFTVRLPAENRALSTERLKIIHQQLQRESKSGILITEDTSTPTPVNTLWLEAK